MAIGPDLTHRTNIPKFFGIFGLRGSKKKKKKKESSKNSELIQRDQVNLSVNVLAPFGNGSFNNFIRHGFGYLFLFGVSFFSFSLIK